MRFIHVYLIAYFLLLLGAAVALWRGGVLSHISPFWAFIVALVAVGLGLLLAVTSRRPTATRS